MDSKIRSATKWLLIPLFTVAAVIMLLDYKSMPKMIYAWLPIFLVCIFWLAVLAKKNGDHSKIKNRIIILIS